LVAHALAEHAVEERQLLDARDAVLERRLGDVIHHLPPLALHPLEQRVLALGQVGAEGDVKVFRQQLGIVDRRLRAQLQIVHLQLAGDRLGLFQQGAGRGVVVRHQAAADGERDRHQRVAEEQALELEQGQHAHDMPVAQGGQVVGAVAERALHQPAPAELVEEGGAGGGAHVAVPLALAVVTEEIDRHGRRRRGRNGDGARRDGRGCGKDKRLGDHRPRISRQVVKVYSEKSRASRSSVRPRLR
jgi:hypothetical protein